MSERDWFIRWDRESIIQALLAYKERTGVAPTVTNLAETGMPKSLTIQTHCGMRASVFLKTLFPETRRKKEATNPFGFGRKEEWIACFREQFVKHNCPRSREYDFLRDKETPAWGTIAKHAGLNGWKDLMVAANVNYKERIEVTHEVKIGNTKSKYISMLEEQNAKREELLYKILNETKK